MDMSGHFLHACCTKLTTATGMAPLAAKRHASGPFRRLVGPNDYGK